MLEATALLRWSGFAYLKGFNLAKMTWSTGWRDTIAQQSSGLYSHHSGSNLNLASHGQPESIRPYFTAFKVKSTQLERRYRPIASIVHISQRLRGQTCGDNGLRTHESIDLISPAPQR